MSDPYRELFERSADAILFIEGGTFVDCNQAAVEMLRCRNRAEVLSTHPSELSPEFQPDGRRSFEKANEMIATAFTNGSHRFEWDHVRADGEVFPVEVLLTAVGERLHVVWRDISERKALEARLRNSQKLEIVGRLAAGVAHDFNNLLVVVLGNSDLAIDELGEGSRVRPLIEEIRDAGERGSHLVKRLLAIGRKQTHMPAALELADLVEDLRPLLVRLLGRHVELQVEHHERGTTVIADRGQLEQALLNLATNARDAMSDGGVLTIHTGLVPREACAHLGLETAADRVGLLVHDTGAGMDTATLARATEPFYTTKPSGMGTGLGLAAVDSAVTKSGGQLELASVVGRGTCVAMTWPREQAAPTRTVTPTPAIEDTEARSLEGVRVLVVEDEDPVAQFVDRSLTDSGCVLTRASNGQAALDLLTAEPRPRFDLIVSDVIMPVMGGPEMVKLLRERGVDTPVVFMSGFTDDAIAAAGLAADSVLLEKPFSPWELRRAIRLELS